MTITVSTRGLHESCSRKRQNQKRHAHPQDQRSNMKNSQFTADFFLMLVRHCDKRTVSSPAPPVWCYFQNSLVPPTTRLAGESCQLHSVSVKIMLARNACLWARSHLLLAMTLRGMSAWSIRFVTNVMSSLCLAKTSARVMM